MTRSGVAVVDDDALRREEIVDRLRQAQIDVRLDAGHDEASEWNATHLAEIKIALVDVYDDAAPLELGTDLFSGLKAVSRFRQFDIVAVAVTPHRHHPLVEQRIFEAGPSSIYRRWELNNPDILASAATRPDPKRAPVPVPRRLLHRYGAAHVRLNEAVKAYESSRLNRLLRADVTQKSLLAQHGITYRQIGRFTDQMEHLGLQPPRATLPPRDQLRWPDVMDFLLTILGRMDAPSSEFDGHENLWHD